MGPSASGEGRVVLAARLAPTDGAVACAAAGSYMEPAGMSSPEQPSQAPQDSDDSRPHEQLPRSRKGSCRQPSSFSAGQQAASALQGQGTTAAVISGSISFNSVVASPRVSGPASDGRTVVLNGLKMDTAGAGAKQQATEFCRQFGDVNCCWLRKGKSSYWFAIVQFAEVLHAMAALIMHTAGRVPYLTPCRVYTPRAQCGSTKLVSITLAFASSGQQFKIATLHDAF